MMDLHEASLSEEFARTEESNATENVSLPETTAEESKIG